MVGTLFHGAAGPLGGHADLGPTHLVTLSDPMIWLIWPAEAASPMGVAPKKMVTGLVATATMDSESPFTLRAGSAIVTSASTRAALTPSTVSDDVLDGPRVGD